MNVLIAEDNPVLAALLRSLLREWDYQVVNAEDGLKAWESLRSEGGPRLAILDWMMPGIDGTEVCRRVRDQSNRYVYIILVTAKSGSDDVVKGMEAGADDYLTKPFEPRELRLRLRAGRRVIEFQERYRIIAETASDGIITTDQAGRIQFANDAACQIFGHSVAELRGADMAQLILGFHDWRTAENHSAQPVELRGKHSSGREILLETSLSRFFDDGSRLGFTMLIRDVTDQRNNEKQRAHLQKLESIGQLAAGVAHEINTPIQYVSDNTRFLQDSVQSLEPLLDGYERMLSAAKAGVVPRELVSEVDRLEQDADITYLRAEIPRAIDQSLEGVKHVAEIVRAMKEFSHPGPLEMVPTDLNQLIRSTIVISRNEWKYVADLVTDFDEDLPLVECVPTEFNQVIVNLIVNAAHAITDVVGNQQGEKGQITISTRRHGEFAQVRIRDTGTGIPEAVRSKIFDPFFTTKEVGSGTGQGLAIAHSIIVSKHQGSIIFETEVGAGTTFVIDLPILRSARQESQKEFDCV